MQVLDSVEGILENKTSNITADEGDDDDTLPSITPMEPLQGAQHYNYVRGLTELLHMSNKQGNTPTNSLISKSFI